MECELRKETPLPGEDGMQKEQFSNGKKILFMPHCGVLAHAGRMLLVAQALRERFSGMIEFAGKGKYGVIFPESGFTFHEIEGGSPLNKPYALYQKRWSMFELPAFFRRMYHSYLEDIARELALYKKVKPDLVVWDARFTVPVSAEVFGVPIISVLPAYGTPYSTIRPGLLRRNPIFIRYPWLLFVIRLPQKVQDGLLDSFSKWFFYLFVRYINRIRIAYGLEPVMSMSDLAEKLQTVIMPDVEMVVPTKDLPPNFHYVGPLVWQPQMEVPEPIKDLQDVIYVSMGSTGSPDVLKLLIGACSQMREFQVVITTGELIDSTRLGSLPENLHVYKSLPGIEMAKRTRLVICHGGAGTIAQALSQGVPIIGIPFNAQQDFVMDRIVSLEAGIKLDPSELSPQKIRQTVDEVLANESYRKVAATMASKYTLERGPQRAAEIILRKLSDIRAKEEST